MKCLINCRSASTEWMRKYFFDMPPYMVRIANKPLLEYYIEFCSICGISEVRFISEEPQLETEEYFRDGAKWNVKITYGSSRQNQALDSIIERNRLLLAGDDLLIINGFIFLEYDKHKSTYDFFEGSADRQIMDQEMNGLLLLRKNNVLHKLSSLKFIDSEDPVLSVRTIKSVKDLYDLNMQMTRPGEAEKYIMLSYNNEDGVYIGQNVEIMRECEVEKPVIIGSNIQLKNLSKIGPCAIIGDNSLVDARTTIRDSVVYGDSYIGSDLEISNKIIYKRRVIDPVSGEVLDIVDNFLLSEISDRIFREYLCLTVFWIAGACLLLMQLPLYLLLGPFVSLKYELKDFWSNRASGGKLACTVYHKSASSFINKLFFKFSLDKINLIGWALRGKLFLVGNKPQEATTEKMDLLNELPSYRPAAFYYAETVGEKDTEFQDQIDELYYSHHRNLPFDLKIILYTLVQRLFRQINE